MRSFFLLVVLLEFFLSSFLFSQTVRLPDEVDQMLSDIEKQFEKIEKAMTKYEDQIDMAQPERSAQNYLFLLDNALKRCERDYKNMEFLYSRWDTHPRWQKTQMTFLVLQSKYTEVSAEVGNYAIALKSSSIIIGARQLIKKAIQSEEIFPSPYFKKAEEQYQRLEAYLQKNGEIRMVEEFRSQIQKDLRLLPFFRFRDACESSLRAVRKGLFDWEERNIELALQLSEKNQEMKPLLRKYQAKIIEEGCLYLRKQKKEGSELRELWQKMENLATNDPLLNAIYQKMSPLWQEEGDVYLHQTTEDKYINWAKVKAGVVYGYVKSDFWGKCLDINEKGEVRGYSSSRSWELIGLVEKKENKVILSSPVGDKIAECFFGKEVFFYEGGTQKKEAVFKDNGVVERWQGDKRRDIAVIHVNDVSQKLAILVFLVLREDG